MSQLIECVPNFSEGRDLSVIRRITDVVEAGSTMKAFLVASALDAGTIDADQEFDTGEGWMRVRGKTIRDHEPYGVLRPDGILRVSSNVGAVQIAQLMGREAPYRGLLRFGFGASTRSSYPMESAGLARKLSPSGRMKSLPSTRCAMLWQHAA